MQSATGEKGDDVEAIDNRLRQLPPHQRQRARDWTNAGTCRLVRLRDSISNAINSILGTFLSPGSGNLYLDKRGRRGPPSGQPWPGAAWTRYIDSTFRSSVRHESKRRESGDHRAGRAICRWKRRSVTSSIPLEYTPIGFAIAGKRDFMPIGDRPDPEVVAARDATQRPSGENRLLFFHGRAPIIRQLTVPLVAFQTEFDRAVRQARAPVQSI